VAGHAKRCATESCGFWVPELSGASCRHQKWAYGAGISIAAFWNYINLFVNTFIRNGVEALGVIISGGHVANPGTIIAIPAALGHSGMIVFCLWAYLGLGNKRLTDIGIL
jgi:hypothetical protein